MIGATDEQALTMGALAGAFEYLFEKYELESLIGNVDDGVLKALFKQSLSEGFGEGMTTVANYAADSLIMADKPELSRLMAKYIAKDPTLTEAQARKEALKSAAGRAECSNHDQQSCQKCNRICDRYQAGRCACAGGFSE